MDKQPEDYESGIDLSKALEGSVELKNVNFAYSEDGENVLNNISLMLRKVKP